MARRIHVLTLPLVFPAGIAAGESGQDNRLNIARNGAGQPVLRGTSLAGRLRHVWRRRMSRIHSPTEVENAVTRFFGSAAGDDADDSQRGNGSPLRVGDVVLTISRNANQRATVIERTHHLRDRHTGVVADGGLFSLEACPPGTSGIATLWLHDDDESPDDMVGFLASVVELFEQGATLGGKSARGIGMARLQAPAGFRTYDLRQAESHAQYLDDHRVWRNQPNSFTIRETWNQAAAATHDSSEQERLCVSLVLGIPRGQDLLVADGQGIQCDAEPQRVVDADGRWLWRLPGSSLRGVMRGWFTRLAAREDAGKQSTGTPSRVADSVERRTRVAREKGQAEDTLNGDNLGWAFLPKDQRHSQTARTACPVANLFGTLFRAGRVHISDAYAPCTVVPPSAEGGMPEEQLRKHVAVDAISGGAVESLLFENSTLVGTRGTSSPAKAHSAGPSAGQASSRGLRFEVFIQIERPEEDEVRWLVKTLRALDVGVLRVGSSKSSGRLSLVTAPEATGPYADLVKALQPYFSSNHFYS